MTVCAAHLAMAVQGITLYTSRDGSKNFQQACLPVAIKVRG